MSTKKTITGGNINGLGVLILIALAFGGGYIVSDRTHAVDPITQVEGLDNLVEGLPEGVDFTEFWSVWNTINDRFVPTLGTTTPEVSNQEKVWGAINGLTRSLGDPYTVFFPPEDLSIFQSDISGNFEGVGMEVAMQNGYVTIVAPLPGTPAQKAGVRPGDVIVKIDGESSEAFSVDQAVRRIRGERGTVVTLTVAREGESDFIDIPITRDVIEIPTIKTSAVKQSDSSSEKITTDSPAADPALRDDGIYVIELYNFGATSPQLFREAITKFAQSGSHKLVFDLRGNPGGYLEAAVDIASYFLPEGKLVVSEVLGAEKEERAHRSLGHTLLAGAYPEIVLLVDRGSASASEIVAGALKEHGVATVVGERTFGKGSVQELIPVNESSAIKVTIARWLTPDGISLSQMGLTPDVEVGRSNEDILSGKDPQFEKAVEILNAKN